MKWVAIKERRVVGDRREFDVYVMLEHGTAPRFHPTTDNNSVAERFSAAKQLARLLNDTITVPTDSGDSIIPGTRTSTGALRKES